MTALSERTPAAASTGERADGARRPHAALVAGVVVLLVVAAVVRFVQPRDLWLDEALSVDIARLPPGQLLQALRHDGSPPLWYLLLHYWIAVFGQGTRAVRAFSGVVSLATLPLAWQLGRRLGGPRVGTATLLLLAGAPFAVRYASETRMYTLIVLEVCLGGLALMRALAPPTRPGLAGQVARLAPLTVVALALALTHYWSLFLLIVVGVGLLVTRRRGPVLALVAAGVLFSPQLPTLLYQQAHTGTPWAPATDSGAVVETLVGWGGPGFVTVALPVGFALLGLACLGVLARATPQGLLLRWRSDPPGRALLGLSVGTLAVAALVTTVAHSGYVARYTAVALPAYVLLAALGVSRLPHRAGTIVLAAVTACGLVAGTYDAAAHRTQAGDLAAGIAAATVPGDVVVYCPDQLAPAIHRLLPPGRTEISYGDPLGPTRVDWVDYIAHNAALSPDLGAAMAVVAAGNGHAVVLVGADGYRTFGGQCDALADALAVLRGDPRVLVHRDRAQGESAAALLYAAPDPDPGRPAPDILGTAVLDHRELLES